MSFSVFEREIELNNQNSSYFGTLRDLPKEISLKIVKNIW